MTDPTDTPVPDDTATAVADQAAPPPAKLKELEAAQTELLADPAAQRDLARAEAKHLDKAAAEDKFQPPADLNMYDGRAYDDLGNVAESRLASGQAVKMRSNVNGLADGTRFAR